MAKFAGKTKFYIASTLLGEVNNIGDWTQSTETFTAQAVGDTVVTKLTDGIVNPGELTVSGNLDLTAAQHVGETGLESRIGTSITGKLEYTNGASHSVTGILKDFTITGMGFGSPLGFTVVVDLTAKPTFTAAGDES